MKEVTYRKDHPVAITVVDNAKLRLVQRDSIISKHIELLLAALLCHGIKWERAQRVDHLISL